MKLSALQSVGEGDPLTPLGPVVQRAHPLPAVRPLIPVAEGVYEDKNGRWQTAFARPEGGVWDLHEGIVQIPLRKTPIVMPDYLKGTAGTDKFRQSKEEEETAKLAFDAAAGAVGKGQDKAPAVGDRYRVLSTATTSAHPETKGLIGVVTDVNSAGIQLRFEASQFPANTHPKGLTQWYRPEMIEKVDDSKAKPPAAPTEEEEFPVGTRVQVINSRGADPSSLNGLSRRF